MKRQIFCIVALSGIAAAAVSGPVEEQIRIRQSAYSFIGWNTGRIKSQLDHPENYNQQQVVAAANAIAAVANSGLGSLFGPGSDKGTGWRPTKVRPEFFQKPDEAKAAALAFNKEANELARIAATGTPAEIKTQFSTLSETCKSCHSKFRERD